MFRIARRTRLSMILVGAALVVAVLASSAMAATGNGTRARPHAARTMTAIPGSDGWAVRVNKSIPNGTSAVLAENMFNDKPKAGRQFFIINVTVSYRGKGSDSPFSGLSFYALGRSNVAYDESGDSCGVVPKELDSFKKVFSGGTISGNLCFSVKRSDAASLLLMVEPSFSFDDTQIFFRTR
jgi:hypothetical protein